MYLNQNQTNKIIQMQLESIFSNLPFRFFTEISNNTKPIVLPAWECKSLNVINYNLEQKAYQEKDNSARQVATDIVHLYQTKEINYE
jgi:hypothetical protein